MRMTHNTLSGERIGLRPYTRSSDKQERSMKKIQVRKTETIRLTSAAQPLYAGECGTHLS